jgi:hypothetical protein
LPPWEKPKPANFPEKDPLAFVLPLMDAYAGPEREKYRDSPLLHPILADIESMPRNMLFIAGKVDILLHEQTVFVNRLKDEAAVLNRKIRLSTEASGENPTDEVLENVDSLTARPGTATQHPYYHIQGMFFDDQIHGWIERMYL